MREENASFFEQYGVSLVDNTNNLKGGQSPIMQAKNQWDSFSSVGKGLVFAGVALLTGYCIHETVEHGYKFDLDLTNKTFSYGPSDHLL